MKLTDKFFLSSELNRSVVGVDVEECATLRDGCQIISEQTMVFIRESDLTGRSKNMICITPSQIIKFTLIIIKIMSD